MTISSKPGVNLALVLSSLIASSTAISTAVHRQIELEEAAIRLLAITPADHTNTIRIALYHEFLSCGDMLEAINRVHRSVSFGELP